MSDYPALDELQIERERIGRIATQAVDFCAMTAGITAITGRPRAISEYGIPYRMYGFRIDKFSYRPAQVIRMCAWIAEIMATEVETGAPSQVIVWRERPECHTDFMTNTFNITFRFHTMAAGTKAVLKENE